MNNIFFYQEYDNKTMTHYYFLKIPFDKYIPEVVYLHKTQNIVEYLNNNNIILSINAGLFNSNINCYEPEGIVLSNKQLIQQNIPNKYPDAQILTIDNQGFLNFTKTYYDINNSITNAVHGFMPIVLNYKSLSPKLWINVPHFYKPRQRQIIGQFENGDYGILTCDGYNQNNSRGWTISEAQQFCKKLNFKFAFNLDGGTSTETILNNVYINTVYKTDINRKSPTYIIFKNKKKEDTY